MLQPFARSASGGPLWFQLRDLWFHSETSVSDYAVYNRHLGSTLVSTLAIHCLSNHHRL